MRRLKAFGLFWYDFVVGDDWRIAVGLGLFLERTRIGRIVHATAENRDMAEGLGVNASKIFALVFTVGWSRKRRPLAITFTLPAGLSWANRRWPRASVM